MSARTEKAHNALADAHAIVDEHGADCAGSARQKLSTLLDIAAVQAAIAQAEALEAIVALGQQGWRCRGSRVR